MRSKMSDDKKLAALARAIERQSDATNQFCHDLHARHAPVQPAEHQPDEQSAEATTTGQPADRQAVREEIQRGFGRFNEHEQALVHELDRDYSKIRDDLILRGCSVGGRADGGRADGVRGDGEEEQMVGQPKAPEPESGDDDASHCITILKASRLPTRHMLKAGTRTMPLMGLMPLMSLLYPRRAK